MKQRVSVCVLATTLISGFSVTACSSSDPAPADSVADGGTDATVSDSSATDSSETGTANDSAADTGNSNDSATTDAASDSGGSCALTTSPSNSFDFGPLEIGQYNPNYLKGVEVEAVPCGKVPSNDEGNGWIHPPHPGIPFYYKLTKADYLPSLSMEFQTFLNQGGTFAQSKSMLLVPSATASTSLPDFDATKASVIIRIHVGGAGCNGGKYTVTLDGHPEAKVTYWTNVPESSGKADKTLVGVPAGNEAFISITGATPGPLAPFKVTAAGSSCNPSVTSPYPDGRTGNVPLEAGSVSVVDLYGY